MKKARISGLLIFLLITVSSGYSQTSHQLELTGYNMVPSVRTTATGMMEATVKGDSLFISGQFEDLMGRYWSAYIHYGDHDEEGNRLLKLSADVSEDHKSGIISEESNSFLLPQALREALKEGKLYVVISSGQFKQGEIRGQIPMM